MKRTNKSKEELLKELELLESKGSEKETHTITVMNQEGEMIDLEREPRKSFNAVEKAKITTSVAQLEEVSDTIYEVLGKHTEAYAYEWVLLVAVLDEIMSDTLSIAYDLSEIDGVKVPSLPNLDLFVMFLQSNQDWLQEKAKLFGKQLELISEQTEK